MKRISWILFISIVSISLLLAGFGCKTAAPAPTPTTPAPAAPAEKVHIDFYAMFMGMERHCAKIMGKSVFLPQIHGFSCV